MNQNTKKAYIFVPEQFVIIAKTEVLTEIGNIVVEKKMVKKVTDKQDLDVYVEIDYEVPGGYLIEA